MKKLIRFVSSQKRVKKAEYGVVRNWNIEIGL